LKLLLQLVMLGLGVKVEIFGLQTTLALTPVAVVVLAKPLPLQYWHARSCLASMSWPWRAYKVLALAFLNLAWSLCLWPVNISDWGHCWLEFSADVSCAQRSYNAAVFIAVKWCCF